MIAGAFTQAAMKKFGFETLGEYFYEEYEGLHPETGERCFRNMGVHKKMVIAGRKLPMFNQKSWDL